MGFLNQISFKYYENLGIYYILYCLSIHQKELKSIQPLFLYPGAWLLFVGRSMNGMVMVWMVWYSNGMNGMIWYGHTMAWYMVWYYIAIVLYDSTSGIISSIWTCKIRKFWQSCRMVELWKGVVDTLLICSQSISWFALQKFVVSAFSIQSL